MARFNEKTLLNAVTADTTSEAFSVEEYETVGFQLLAAGISAGNGVFTFEGTIDGINWVALNVLVTNVTNTNVQNLTRVASVTLSSNTSSLVWLEKTFALKAVRVKVDRTTDGTYSAFAIGKE